jgi:hypothetical protein
MRPGIGPVRRLAPAVRLVRRVAFAVVTGTVIVALYLVVLTRGRILL